MSATPEQLRIPPAYAAPCDLCGGQLDTRAAGVHQWTAGWVMNRQRGGGHAISLAVKERRWAHKECVQDPASIHQGRMF